MLADALSAQHVDIFVTGLARDGARFIELVGSVAADAFRVAFGKQSARRNDWLLPRVTGSALRARRGGRRVLMLVADAARGARRLAVSGVSGRDLAVTNRTRGGLRPIVLVGLVAPQAFARRMNRDWRSIALSLGVTPPAIPHRMPAKCAVAGPARSGVSRPFERESVALSAVRAGARTEALLSLTARMFDPALFFVASGAAFGSHGSNRVACQLVALGAFDLFAHHVDLVPGRFARLPPLGPYVDSQSVRTALTFVATLVGARGSDGEDQPNQEPERRKLGSGIRHATGMIVPAASRNARD
jgi:hypothetical protein